MRYLFPILSGLLSTALLGCGSATAPTPSAWRELAPIPDERGVAAPFAGGIDDKLFVAGGANFPDKMPWEDGKKVWHDRIWMLDTPEGTWREVGKLPHPLAYGVSVTTPQGLVCIGGSDENGPRDEVFRLARREGKVLVETLPKLPRPRANAVGAAIDQTIYLTCGTELPGESAATNVLLSLDLNNLEAGWVEREPMPGKHRILPTIGVADGALYVFGGVALISDTRVYLDDVYRYQPGKGWTQRANLPKPLAASPSPAPMVNGKLQLFSGDDGTLRSFQPVSKHPGWSATSFAYNPTKDRWNVVAGALPAPRVTVPVVSWQGLVVVPSGEVRPGVRSPQVWALPLSP